MYPCVQNPGCNRRLRFDVKKFRLRRFQSIVKFQVNGDRETIALGLAYADRLSLLKNRPVGRFNAVNQVVSDSISPVGKYGISFRQFQRGQAGGSQ